MLLNHVIKLLMKLASPPLRRFELGEFYITSLASGNRAHREHHFGPLLFLFSTRIPARLTNTS